MAAEDVAATRMVRQQVARRYIDASMIDIRVTHGIVYFRGIIRHLRTSPDLDLKKEMDTITSILTRKPGIREVLWDVQSR